jgi:N-acetyl-anhydromuramyl-L-alanine amidase AmpD
LSIIKGIVNHKSVIQKLSNNLEHGALVSVADLVLHRTDSSTAKSTLLQYAKKSTSSGAHFLIAEDGTIYQTAKTNKKCYHVGQVYSRCRIEQACTPAELKTIKGMLHAKGASWKKRFNDVRDHELKKSYPDRYPANNDSIGIEIVGKFDVANSVYPLPNKKQQTSIKWLVKELLATFNLDFVDDVYAHGSIAHKEKSEGVATLKWLATNINKP